MDGATMRKELLKEAVAIIWPELKARGLKKRGLRFGRRRGEMLDIVWIQTDRNPTPGELGIRINPETIPVPLWEKWIVDWPKTKLGPSFNICDLALMQFSEDRRDRWHEVRTADEVQRLVEQTWCYCSIMRSLSWTASRTISRISMPCAVDTTTRWATIMQRDWLRCGTVRLYPSPKTFLGRQPRR